MPPEIPMRTRISTKYSQRNRTRKYLPSVLKATAALSHSPGVAFDVVTDDVKKRWKKKDSGLLRTHAKNSADTSQTSSASPSSSPTPAPSPTGINSSMAPEILRCIGVLRVLHGIVLSFPFEMGQVFGEKTNGGKLLKLVHSQAIPLDIRMVLATLASRWYICLNANPQAQENMAFIVDSFYSETGFLPAVNFLPMAPAKIRHCIGVEYPEINTHKHVSSYMYLPRTGKINTGSARSVATDPMEAANGRKQVEGYVSVQRQSFQVSRPLPPRDQSQQKQEPQLQRRRSLQNAQSQMTSQPGYRPEIFGGKPTVTAEQLSRMITCAQELCSISNMIIDNLVALAIDDDPRTNPVIQDMMGSMSHMHTVAANYISMLSAEHITETRKLKQAIDESKRCQWVYNDTAHTFAVWAEETKDAYKKDGKPLNDKSQGFSGASSSSSTAQKTNAVGSGSKDAGGTNTGGAMPLNSSSQSIGSRPVTGNAEKTPNTVQRMSTKVRGKMADTSVPSDDEQDSE
ncbi:hypothetical protein H4R99_004877 [Coemansia sp. RSA 1722]|nr:hypothetical protein H4R99_004877 [Coemansia sp. RSA 1722]KAJ2597756.1 hypothetical protein GGF39_002920 [Coemansia sp. RSA 1721]